MKEYNIYIDEAGDEGIKKGSKYFILTAILVEKDKDLEVAKSVDKIKQDLKMNIKKQLHWRFIKGLTKKIMIMEIIGKLDVSIINVIIDTKCIQLISSNNIYNYFSGYLYERICWFMTEHNGRANIHISTRGNLSKRSLTNYINNKNYHKFKIDVTKIKQIKIIPNERKKLLQLADCCCSSLFQALKYHDKTHFGYIEKIKNNLYCQNNNLLSYGLKLVPNNSKALELKELILFITKEKK